MHDTYEFSTTLCLEVFRYFVTSMLVVRQYVLFFGKEGVTLALSVLVLWIECTLLVIVCEIGY